MVLKIAMTALALALAAPAFAQEVTVRGPDGDKAVVTAAMMQDMHRFSVTTTYGDHHTYSGPPLSDLLREVGAPDEVRLHGPPLDQIVIVTGADGFTAILAIAETAQSFHGTPVILADQEDGKPLDPKEGPYRLVIGGEGKPARSVHNVVDIELRKVAGTLKPPPPEMAH
jgi:DMSO/TMAO reductase YedYZ molybdopterin-dependent catalytic subunit